MILKTFTKYDIPSLGVFLGDSETIFTQETRNLPVTDFEEFGQVDPTQLINLIKRVSELSKNLNFLISEMGDQKIRLDLQKRIIGELQDRIEVLSTPSKEEIPSYLTTQQVSLRTGYSTDYILEKVKQGILEPTGKSGKSKKFRIEEVERFMSLKDLNRPRDRKSKNGKTTKGR